MLLEKLEEELIERMNLSKKIFPIIFFYDKNENFRFLVENIKQFKVLFYNNSFLELKYKIIHYKEEKPLVIYLPIDKKEDLLYLMDILVCSITFHYTLYRFMENIGVSFPKDKKKRREIINLLPSMINEHFEYALSDWNELFGMDIIKDFTTKFRDILFNPKKTY